MKFTEQEAVEALGGKVKALNQNLTPQSIDLVKHLFKFAKEDDTLDAFIDGVKDVFVGFAKQAPNELSLLIKSRELVNTKDVQALVDKGVEDFKKTNPSPPTEEKEKDPQLQAVIDRLAAIEQENQTLKNERLISTKRNDILNAFKAKGVTETEWLNQTIEFAPVSADTDIDSYVDLGVKLYNKDKSKVPNDPPIDKSSGRGASEGFFKSLSEMGKKDNNNNKLY